MIYYPHYLILPLPPLSHYPHYPHSPYSPHYHIIHYHILPIPLIITFPHYPYHHSNSVRRLRARPSTVSLVSTGRVFPKPLARSRVASMPCWVK